jgi:hypothetical protein
MNIALFLTMTVLASPAEAGGVVHAETLPSPAVAPSNAPNNAQKTDGEQTSTCPTREAVAAALSPALAHIRPNLDPLPSDFRLADLGDAYEVTVGGQVQRYADAARDCAERARVAAVFVALAMNPPSLEPPRPPPPVPPPVVQQPQPPPTPEPDVSWLSVGVAARIDGAVGGDGDATSGATAGGELDVAFGRGSLGIEATAGLVTSTQNTIASVQVTQQRFPCSLSATFRRRASAHLEVGAGVGAALTPFTLHGQGLDTTLPVTRFDVGARLALELRVARPGLAPFASLHAEYFPRTYEIVVAPIGNIGTTAPLQLGFSLGVAFETRR